jgi:hypothetical protein
MIDGFTDLLYYYNENPALGLDRARLRGCVNLAESKITAMTTAETKKPKIVIRTKSGAKYILPI